MEITDVKIFPVNEDKLKAFVSIILDSCFVISDIKIILGNNGLFVSMPSKKRKNGTFRDLAHPLNNETRSKMEERIFEEYFKSGTEKADVMQPRSLAEGAERRGKPGPGGLDDAEHEFPAPDDDDSGGPK